MSLTRLYYLHEIGEKKTQEDYIWPVAGAANLQSSIFIVCDGVGGSEHGEVASKIVAETVGELLINEKENEISPDYIEQLLQQAKKQLVLYASRHGLSNDMATTFSLLVLLPGRALISWCGDTRVYHIRNGEILFKTEDHSLVNNLIKKGELSEDEAKSYPGSNIILKAIKADDAPAGADFHWVDTVIKDDYFVLCTDGLLENISNDDLSFLLRSENGDKKDILGYVREKCKDQTRDNYSMYLLQVNTDPIDTNAVLLRKKKRAGIIALLLILVVIVSVAFLVKTNTATSSGPTKQDTVVNQKEDGSKPIQDTKMSLELKTDSLPVFEIESSPDSTSNLQKDVSFHVIESTANANSSPAPNNIPVRKKKTKKGSLPAARKKTNY